MSEQGEILETVRSARRWTRQQAQIGWIPLTVFGVITAGSLVVIAALREPAFPGLRPFSALPVYWFVALPVGYATAAVLIEWRSRWRGVRPRMRAYVLGGLALIGFYVVASASGMLWFVGDFTVRGTAPAVSIGLALIVLAVTQRSLSLLISASVVIAASLVASLYNVENVAFDLGVPFNATAGAWANEAFFAVVLLLCAGVVRVSGRSRVAP